MPGKNTRKATYHPTIDTISAIAKKSLVDNTDESKALDAIVSEWEDSTINEADAEKILDYLIDRLETRLLELDELAVDVRQKLALMKL